MSRTSKYISEAAVRGLNRFGDVICPGDGVLPSYSTTGCVEHVDIALEHAPSSDIADLGLFLAIMSVMPGFVLRWLVGLMAESHGMNGPHGPAFRQLNLGLRGIIFGTYYSGMNGRGYNGPDTHSIVGYSIDRIED